MSKTCALCFIRGSRHLETIKALGLRPCAFICFSVSGTPDETLTLVFDILREISRRCLFHYREHVFRISVTGIPLVFLPHSVPVAAWSGIARLDPQMIHFELFYHLVRTSQFSPQTIFVWFRQLKKTYILGIHPKKIIIPSTAGLLCFTNLRRAGRYLAD